MSNELKVVLVNRETFYHEADYVRRLEKLAAAVLLFHRGGEWSDNDRQMWRALTDSEEATTKTLCDLARRTQG